MPALISAGGAAAARRALAKTLVHVYDRTPMTTTNLDGDEIRVPGTATVGLACRYEAQGATVRDPSGTVTVSAPSLTVMHDDVLALGDLVTAIRNSTAELLLAGPLVVARRLDDDPLGITLQRVYELRGADPMRAV